MRIDFSKKIILPWALETGLALILSLMVLFFWPENQVGSFASQALWFSLGWFLLLGVPALWRLFVTLEPNTKVPQTIKPKSCGQAAFASCFLFVCFLIAGPVLGNFKLWLGIVYISGIILRLSGLALHLRVYIFEHPTNQLGPCVTAGAISSLACILLIPWARPDIALIWPPDGIELAFPLIQALLWGFISGTVFLGWQVVFGGKRTAWLAYLAIGLGPGPALAVTLFTPMPLLIVLALLAGPLIFKFLSPKKMALPQRKAKPISLYWLLRAMMLLWWGCGAFIALASAWWHPHMEALLYQGIWIRALILGGFLVACLGVLAEYTLPLFGKSDRLAGSGQERKVLGIILSSLALLSAIPTLLLTDPWQAIGVPKEYQGQALIDLIEEPINLDSKKSFIELKPPASLGGLTHVYIVGRLVNASRVPEGVTVAKVTVDFDLFPRRTFNLRAGIDTADRDLKKRDVAVIARHKPARIFDRKIVFTSAGEGYTAQTYLTGLFLGQRVNRIYSIKVSLEPGLTDGKDVIFEILRLFTY